MFVDKGGKDALDRARLRASFAPQQLFLIPVLWGEVPCSSWGERCSRAASQGPGAWTGGSPGSEITLSLLLLPDKRALPFSAAALRSLSPELGSPAGRDEHVHPPLPSQLSNPVVAVSRVCRNVI